MADIGKLGKTLPTAPVRRVERDDATEQKSKQPPGKGRRKSGDDRDAGDNNRVDTYA